MAAPTTPLGPTLHVGVLTETALGEQRVALDPTAVAKLVKAGRSVYIESETGEAASFTDAAGRLICVAMPAAGNMEIPIFETVVKGISVIGSIVGTRQDLAEVFALHAEGRTRVVAQVRALDDVSAAMSEVVSGAILARLVFQFAPAPVVAVEHATVQ